MNFKVGDYVFITIFGNSYGIVTKVDKDNFDNKYPITVSKLLNKHTLNYNKSELKKITNEKLIHKLNKLLTFQ